MDKINRLKSRELKACIMEIRRDEARLMLSQSNQETLSRYQEGAYRAKIDRFIDIMAKGEWSIFNKPGGIGKFVFDPILITPNGCVYEGKHRMVALSEQEKNIKIEFLVILGFGEKYTSEWGAWRNALKAKTEGENG